FAELLEGKTVSESLSSAKTTHGNNDGSPKQAEPLISGSNDLTIITEGITNGSFELGGLNSWTTNGDVRVIPKLGAFNPDDGKYMGIISTGLGSVNESISEISQKFNIPAGKEKLELTYNFVSEEPLEYLNSKYDDYYKILVITPSGDTVLVDSGSINFFSDESFWNPADINFDGGDNTAYYIGWQTKSLNLSQYISSEGKRKGYTLIIIVGDKGDSIYDSALLIDNIKLVEP
ncbi:MAG TPA: choice-of-anchor L domain-containing protein, partial [bacterium]|nr:choice-of-anchor L domain-containing protein [bacterium]